MRWTEGSFLKPPPGAAFARRAPSFLGTAPPLLYCDPDLTEGPMSRLQADVGFLEGAALSGAILSFDVTPVCHGSYEPLRGLKYTEGFVLDVICSWGMGM